MNRKVVLGLGLLLAGSLAGCGDDSTPTGPGTDGGPRTDAGGVRPDGGGVVNPPGDNTYDFVVDVLRIAKESAMGAADAPGFDLDMHNTSNEMDPIGCYFLDSTSPAAYGGYTGVDNQLGPLLDQVGTVVGMGFDANTTIAENITKGSLLLLVRVTGVGDGAGLQNDGNVEVRFYLGELAEGVTMPMTDMMMRLTGGQTFRVNPVSVMDGDLDKPVIKFAGARIVNGRVHAGPDLFALNVPVGTFGTLALNVQEAQIEFDITQTAISNGLIGGFVTVDEIVMAIRSLMLSITLPEATVRSVLQAQADIDTDQDATHCEALSLGLVLEGVPATFTMVAPPSTTDAGTGGTDAGAPRTDAGAGGTDAGAGGTDAGPPA